MSDTSLKEKTAKGLFLSLIHIPPHRDKARQVWQGWQGPYRECPSHPQRQQHPALQSLSDSQMCIRDSAHPGYVIDDADFIETPDGSYFLVEMEQGEREIYVKVTAEGEILP